jgi:hypothetical protein
MTRSLKVLGLTVGTALALVAWTSSAVAANPQFHSEADHTTLSGFQESRNVLSVNAGLVHCSTASFEGTQTNDTVTQFTIAPTYKGCLITTPTLETLEAVVDMNGCHYLFTPSGEVHLTCPSAPIRVTAPLCTITLHPQTVNKVDYTNENGGATRSITVTSTATNLAYTQSSFCHPGGGAFNNGSYFGAVVSACTDTNENHVGCWWATQ